MGDRHDAKQLEKNKGFYFLNCNVMTNEGEYLRARTSQMWKV